MASSWGTSWLTAWGDSWGTTGGAVSSGSGVNRLIRSEAQEAEHRRRVVYQRQQTALAHNFAALQAQAAEQAKKVAKQATGKPLGKATVKKLNRATEPEAFVDVLAPLVARLEKYEQAFEGAEVLRQQLAEIKALIERQEAKRASDDDDDDDVMISMFMMGSI